MKARRAVQNFSDIRDVLFAALKLCEKSMQTFSDIRDVLFAALKLCEKGMRPNLNVCIAGGTS